MKRPFEEFSTIRWDQIFALRHSLPTRPLLAGQRNFEDGSNKRKTTSLSYAFYDQHLEAHIEHYRVRWLKVLANYLLSKCMAYFDKYFMRTKKCIFLYLLLFIGLTDLDFKPSQVLPSVLRVEFNFKIGNSSILDPSKALC